MKRLLFYSTILLYTAQPVFAQEDSPYARFGYEAKVLRTPQERQKQMMLLVSNQDTASAIASVGLDPKNQRYYLFDKNNQVLRADTLTAIQTTRFLSVDPLTTKYPAWAPYAFAMNRVVDGIDMDGQEWSESESHTQGDFQHANTQFTLKIRVVNMSTALKSQADVVKAANNIKQQIVTSFQYSGPDFENQGIVRYSTTVEYDFTPLKPGEVVDRTTGFWMVLEDVTSSTTASGDKTVKMGNSFLGETQGNVIKVAITVDGSKRGAKQYARTGAHEAGHTGGLPHPWMTKEIEEAGQDDINQIPSSKSKPKATKKEVRQNLMDSDENPDPSYRSPQGKQVTRKQIESMSNQIPEQ